MSDNWETVLAALLGLMLLGAWYFGYDALALWLFIAGFAVLFGAHMRRVQQLARGILTEDGHQMAQSIAALMSETPGRDRATSIVATLGEASCWPIRVSSGMIIGVVMEHVMFGRVPQANPHERAACMWFVIPLVLLILLSICLQSLFLITQFAPEKRAILPFQVSVGITAVGYVAFLSHFSLRKEFLRNFTSSAVPPSLYFALALCLVLVAAILVRLLFDVTFYRGDDTLSAETAFATARAIVLNPGVFNIPDAIKEAQTLSDMRAQIEAYVSEMTLQRVLDIFLGFSILTTFGRSAVSVLLARRSDEDRMGRAFHFMLMGSWARVKTEADAIKDRKIWGAVMLLVALKNRDIDQFQAAALEAGPPSSVNLFGPEPDVQLYYGILDYVQVSPIDVKTMLDLLDWAGAHGLGRATRAQLLNVFSLVRPFAPQELDSLTETSTTADASFQMRHLVGEIANPDAEILPQVEAAFPIDTDIAVSSLAAVTLGLFWRVQAGPDVAKVLRRNLALLYDQMAGVLSQEGKVPLLYLAVASHLFQGAQSYQEAFGEGENPAADLLARAESRLRDHRLTYPHQIRLLGETPMVR